MPAIDLHAPQAQNLPRTTARLILFAWAAFWTWFGLSSGLSSHLSPLALTLHVGTPAVLLALLLLLAWKSERAAGWLLVLVALVILLEYNYLMGHLGWGYVLRVGSILAAPPALSGLLFLYSAYTHRDV